MNVKQVQCKKALTRSGLPEYPWALNPYRGCGGGCAYCYSPSVLRLTHEQWGSTLEVRVNMPNVLAKELKNQKAKGETGVVGISTVTDPYQPAEKRFTLTRYCLQQLLRFDRPVSIITKRSLVTRDLDILSGFTSAEVGITITTLDDGQRRIMEPGASPIDDRFRALKECGDAGLRTYAFLGPYYPTAGDEELELLVERLVEVGVSEAIFDGLSLKPGVKDSITSRLANPPSEPGGDEVRLAREMAEAYGVLFDGSLSSVYRRIYAVLEKKCEDKGLRLSAFGSL